MASTDDIVEFEPGVSDKYVDSVQLDFIDIPDHIYQSSDKQAHFVKSGNSCDWCSRSLGSENHSYQCALCFAKLHSTCLRRALSLVFPCPGCKQAISGDVNLLQ